MKKFVLAASAAAMIAATPAFAAPSDTESFAINATVEKACTMQGINDINLGNLPIDLAAGPNALLINGTAQGVTSNFWVSCNDTNSMTLAADPYMQGSRTLQSGDDSSFTDRINYRVSAEGYRGTAALSASGPSYLSATNTYSFNGTPRAAIHREISMRARVVAVDNTLRPLAGTYTANVVVTVSTI